MPKPKRTTRATQASRVEGEREVHDDLEQEAGAHEGRERHPPLQPAEANVETSPPTAADVVSRP